MCQVCTPLHRITSALLFFACCRSLSVLDVAAVTEWSVPSDPRTAGPTSCVHRRLLSRDSTSLQLGSRSSVPVEVGTPSILFAGSHATQCSPDTGASTSLRSSVCKIMRCCALWNLDDPDSSLPGSYSVPRVSSCDAASHFFNAWLIKLQSPSVGTLDP